jgi:hypothetical protein
MKTMPALAMSFAALVGAAAGLALATPTPAPAAGATPQTTRSTGALALDAAFTSAWQFGPFCPPATAPGIECVRFTGQANVPGLGRATSTYVKTFDPVCPGELPVTQFRTAVLEVAGKGAIELALPGTVCGPPAPAQIGPFALTVTGGSGIYAGASGSIEFRSSVYQSSSRCGANLCGTSSDAWVGSLIVPGLDFDLTAPTLRGAVARAVRAARKAKRARVRYAVTAEDAVDGAVRTACKPASGSLFKVGRTRVTCSATDSSANEGRAQFTVTVRRAR